MPVSKFLAQIILDKVLKGRPIAEVEKCLLPRSPEEFPLPPRLPGSCDYTESGLRKRRALLKDQGINCEHLSGTGKEISCSELAGNIEHFVGYAKIPVGIIGPLRINGVNANGDFYIPLATTEGALILSYSRGAYLISLSGGASVLSTTESVSRAPCFIFEKLTDSAKFLAWLIPNLDSLQEIVSKTSRFCEILDVKTSILGKEVYLIFEYTTGDASGQNMVTFATENICKQLLNKSPIKPKHWYIEGNMSGDKKATMLAFTYARGKKVIAESIIPRKLVRRSLHTSPEDIVRYWQVSILGGIQSGSIGVQGHFANALAALFIACGQDVACVSEASVGVTRMDITEEGNLYLSVALPNLILGTVGGGTHIPTASECLDMIGCSGKGKVKKFAEICTAVALAGELSIVASLTAGSFAEAHATYGRKPHRGVDL